MVTEGNTSKRHQLNGRRNNRGRRAGSWAIDNSATRSNAFAGNVNNGDKGKRLVLFWLNTRRQHEARCKGSKLPKDAWLLILLLRAR